MNAEEKVSLIINLLATGSSVVLSSNPALLPVATLMSLIPTISDSFSKIKEKRLQEIEAVLLSLIENGNSSFLDKEEFIIGFGHIYNYYILEESSKKRNYAKSILSGFAEFLNHDLEKEFSLKRKINTLENISNNALNLINQIDYPIEDLQNKDLVHFVWITPKDFEAMYELVSLGIGFIVRSDYRSDGSVRFQLTEYGAGFIYFILEDSNLT
jgi:hypothetical protein